jgi:hypothetical protein
MPIDPEVEEVLSTLIDTVEERVQELKALLSEEIAKVDALAARLDGLHAAGAAGGPGGDARLAELQRQLQALQTQQTQINAFLTGVLRLMIAKQLISQQDMVDVYKAIR